MRFFCCLLYVVQHSNSILVMPTRCLAYALVKVDFPQPQGPETNIILATNLSSDFLIFLYFFIFFTSSFFTSLFLLLQNKLFSRLEYYLPWCIKALCNTYIKTAFILHRFHVVRNRMLCTNCLCTF